LAQADAEYAEAAEALDGSLPPGAQIDDVMPGEYEPDSQFEEGFGGMTAGVQWQCAWISEYEDAHGDEDGPRATAALDALARWPTLPEVAPHIDPDSVDAWNTKAITPARDGDDGVLVAIGDQC
jgi:hypothetical protein